MAAGAKLQKSFQDYFRIPILLKGLGNTSQQTLNQIATIFNQIDRLPITQDYFSTESQQLSISKQKIKKNQQLYQRLKTDMRNRNDFQTHKLLFLSQDFQNDWSQLQIVYRVNFVILVFSAQQLQKGQQNGPYRNSDSSVSSVSDLNQKIHKINLRLKQKDMQLLGVIFLNDTLEYSKSLTPGLKFTIVPGSLPLQQLSMFIEPWVMDLIPLIQKNFLQHILECKWEQNSIIVFNSKEQKSQPKIMKKKKKFRCLKICGDLGLMLHLYRFAYEVYHEAEQQLRKVDDWMWVLGCIQGKLACMTCNAQLHIKQQDLAKQIEQLIEQSIVVSRKIKQQSFQVQNNFKILKLLLHQDKERFDDMIENTLATSKGLTEEEKFFYYSYIGSLYQKAKMERKRNYYYFKASLIIEKFKPQVSQLLQKTIKQSKYIKEWQELNSKLIHKIIQNESYFNPDAEFHLELLQSCTSVLNPQEIQNIHDYLNYGRFQQRVIDTNQQKLLQVKQFSIEESRIKPKLNRLVVDESPAKPNKTGVFVGWKKKLTYLYEEDEPIVFKGTILNNLPFQVRLNVFIDLVDFPQKIAEFSLILPPSYPYKFTKEIAFLHYDQPITIHKVRFQLWNFILYKNIQPEISFQLYEKQPQFSLEIQGAESIPQETDKFKLQMEESSYLSLRCILKKINSIECSMLRITCSVYYDIDVGFQQNQFIFSLQNNFNNVKMLLQTTNPNVKFLESQQKQPSMYFDQNQNILVMKLKKFKATRDHLKKVQINLDYIRQKASKYQFNRQYVIEPKFVNSVWAQVVEISTPELEASMENMKSLSQVEIQQFRKNWNTIENSFLVKIKFLKDKFNLKPFKVWYDLQDKNSDGKVLGINEAILSNLTQGEMWIKLDKIKICSKEKQKILTSSSQEDYSNQSKLKKTLRFRWENIVNKNMQGVINLQISRNPLIFKPKLHFQIQIEKVQQQNIPTCRTYKLNYTIKSELGEEIKPHKVTIKAQSETQLGPEINQLSQTNQIQTSANENSGTNNASILIKGKTKINKLKSRISHNQKMQQKQKSFVNKFSNSLTLKVIKQKLHENHTSEKDFQMSIVVAIQFDEKQIGKWQQIVELN